MTDASMAPGPVPYAGPSNDRRNNIGAPWSCREHGGDSSGAVLYEFDACGYRGAGYDPAARLHVFAFGESDAFGVALPLEDTWPAALTELVRRELGLGKDEVNLVNFADPGGSNAAVARSVISQCGALSPGLAVVNFASPHRTEIAVRDATVHTGPWLNEPENARTLSELPSDDPWGMASKYGHRYLNFPDIRQPQLVMLRELLLVQSFLAARGIPAIATSRRCVQPTAENAATHPVLAPLIDAIDPTFYQPHDEQAPDVDRAHDGTHFGAETHARIAASVFARLVASGRLRDVAESVREPRAASLAADGAPRPERPGASGIGHEVRRFYDALPFNHHGDAKTAASSIRAHSLAEPYPDLHELLQSGQVRSAIEIGCGGGWLTSTLAHHYDVEVTAVDFTPAALERAREVAKRLGVAGRTQFVQNDLFEFEADAPVDLVISLGVLHHTKDCARAFRHVQRFARRGGHVYIGLYHEPGRRPFLQHFRDLVRDQGEEIAFERYRELDGAHAGDASMIRSWFRDQVLHPHETQHTLREVHGWLEDCGLELRSTSINRFAKLGDVEPLFEAENEFEQRSRDAIAAGRYFPGFFTALAIRPTGDASSRRADAARITASR